MSGASDLCSLCLSFEIGILTASVFFSVQFSNMLSHAHGFVARDDGRCEIVVAFRGSHELAHMVTGTWFDHEQQQPSLGSGLLTCKAHRWEPPARPAGISWRREEQHGIGPRRLPHLVQLCTRYRDPHRARSTARLSGIYSCSHWYVRYGHCCPRFVLHVGLGFLLAMRRACLG